MAYEGRYPFPLHSGGTNATSFGTSNGIIKYDGTGLVSSSTLTCNASNYVNNSSQPLCVATVTSTVNNVTGDATNYQIIFDTVVINHSSSYNVSTGVFTAPVAGNYLVTGSVGLNNISAGHTGGIIGMYFTAGAFQTSALNYAAAADANSNIVLPFNAIQAMALNDVVHVSVAVEGSTKTINLLGANPVLTYLNVFLLS